MGKSDDDDLGWLDATPKKKETKTEGKTPVPRSVSGKIGRRRSLLGMKPKPPEAVHSEDETTPVEDLAPEPEDVAQPAAEVVEPEESVAQFDPDETAEPVAAITAKPINPFDPIEEEPSAKESDEEFEYEYEEYEEEEGEPEAELTNDSDVAEAESEEAIADPVVAEDEVEEEVEDENDPEVSQKRGDAMPIPVVQPAKDDDDLEKKSNSVEVTDNEEGSDDEDEKDSKPVINPISASLKKASEAKNEGPVFMVDPAVETWIEEDLTEAVAGATATAKPKKRKPNARVKRKRSFLGFISRAFFILFLLCAIAIAVVWFKRDLLVSWAEKTAIEKLDAEGVFVGYEGAVYEFPRGLVLKDVTIFETAERKIPSLKLTNLGVNADAWQLFSKRNAEGLRSIISIENGAADFFVDGKEICTITPFKADLFATTENLKINRLRGTLGGLDFDIEGMVNLPEPPENAETEPNPDKAAEAPASDEPLLDFSPLIPILEQLAFTPGSEGAPHPKLRINVTLDATTSLGFAADGRFSGRDFRWKDIPFESAGVTFGFNQADAALELPDLLIGYQGGSISGTMTYFLDKNTLDIKSLTSNANLVELASHFAPSINESLSGVEFLDNPTLKMSGFLDLNDPWNSKNVALDYQHWEGLAVTVGDKTIPVRALNGKIALQGGRLETDSFSADILGGALEMKGNIKPSEAEVPFNTIINLKRLPLENIMKLSGQTDSEVRGLMSMDYTGRGAVKDISKMRGSGSIDVENGNFYKVPVVGPIQKLLATVIPLFGNREKSSLTATYNIDSGQFITPDLILRSDGTKVKVNGMINLLSMNTKFEAKANLDGPLGLATGLAAEMLTVEGSGPISEPTIALKGVPEGLSNIAGEATNLLGEGSGAVTEAVEGVLGNLLGGGAATAPQTPPQNPPAPQQPQTPENPAPVPVPEVSPPAPAIGPPGPGTGTGN